MHEGPSEEQDPPAGAFELADLERDVVFRYRELLDDPELAGLSGRSLLELAWLEVGREHEERARGERLGP